MKKKLGKPIVSLVIPAYNEEKYIGRLLNCLKRQDCPKNDFEVIVVDNGSSDKTAEIAQSLGARVVRLGEKGVSLARQEGSLAARGQIIAGTDADVVMPANWVSEVIRTMQDKGIVGVAGHIKAHSNNAWVQILYFLSFEFYNLVKIVLGEVYFSGMNFALRKTVFEKSGGFNVGLMSGEDLDLSLRVAKYGKLVFNRQLVVYSSSRRMQEGSLKSFWRYLVTFLAIRWGIGRAPSFKNYR